MKKIITLVLAFCFIWQFIALAEEPELTVYVNNQLMKKSDLLTVGQGDNAVIYMKLYTFTTTFKVVHSPLDASKVYVSNDIPYLPLREAVEAIEGTYTYYKETNNVVIRYVSKTAVKDITYDPNKDKPEELDKNVYEYKKVIGPVMSSLAQVTNNINSSLGNYYASRNPNGFRADLNNGRQTLEGVYQTLSNLTPPNQNCAQFHQYIINAYQMILQAINGMEAGINNDYVGTQISPYATYEPRRAYYNTYEQQLSQAYQLLQQAAGLYEQLK